MIPLPDPEPLYNVIVHEGRAGRMIATCLTWDNAELLASRWNFEFGSPGIVWAWIEPAVEIGKAVAA